MGFLGVLTGERKRGKEEGGTRKEEADGEENRDGWMDD